jgi:hypothetical protein
MTNKITTKDFSSNYENLSLKELENTNGGSIIFDILKFLNETWPDIKQGYMDARNLN